MLLERPEPEAGAGEGDGYKIIPEDEKVLIFSFRAIDAGINMLDANIKNIKIEGKIIFLND